METEIKYENFIEVATWVTKAYYIERQENILLEVQLMYSESKATFYGNGVRPDNWNCFVLPSSIDVQPTGE